jgi:hypothetical protein
MRFVGTGGAGAYSVPEPAKPVPVPVPRAVNAPRLVNFTGIPEGMTSNGYYGEGLGQIASDRDTLAKLAGRGGDIGGLQNVHEPLGGVGFALGEFENALGDYRARKAEQATRQALAGVIGGIDPTKGPTQADVAAAMQADPAYGEKLYEQMMSLAHREQWVTDPNDPTIQHNLATGETKSTGTGGAWKPSDIASRADDYMKRAQTFNTANDSWASMKEAAALAMAPEGTVEGKGAADYNMIVAFAKLLDPQSVVREGEVKSAAMTEGELGALQGWLNTWKKEGSLTNDIRAGIMTQANSRMKGYYDNAASYRQWIADVAKRNGVNPDDVVPPLGTFEGWTPPKADPNAPKTDPNQPAGDKYDVKNAQQTKNPDGSITYTWPDGITVTEKPKAAK